MSEDAWNHPDDEALRSLALGQLIEADLADISSHLGECPACCHRIDQLAAVDRPQERLQQNAANRGKVLVSRRETAALRHEALRPAAFRAVLRRTRPPEAVSDDPHDPP